MFLRAFDQLAVRIVMLNTEQKHSSSGNVEKEMTIEVETKSQAT